MFRTIRGVQLGRRSMGEGGLNSSVSILRICLVMESSLNLNYRGRSYQSYRIKVPLPHRLCG